MSQAELRIGTSAFTAAGWDVSEDAPGAFYPAGLQPRDYLAYYATKFDTVELDSTFYRAPAASVVKGWYERSPANFIFAAKVPQEITHKKILRDCDADCKQFFTAMDNLKEKLGALLFQFGYFNKMAFKGVDDFLVVLLPFLDKLPRDYKYVVEIRNRYWLVPKLVDSLRERGIALALIDQSWMLAKPADWFAKFDPITADFAYVRLLGDRKGIEQKTKVWNKLIVERGPQVADWVKTCRQIVQRGVKTFVYVNNHYAGFAPGTVEMFRKLWEKSAK